MTFLMFLKVYIPTLISFFILDMIWISVVALNFYKEHLGYLFRSNHLGLDPKWGAVAILYPIMVAGIVLIILPLVEKSESYLAAGMYGAIFGLVVYATYDLTNYALIRDWPLIVVIVDMIWGVVLYTALSLLALYFYKTFKAL